MFRISSKFAWITQAVALLLCTAFAEPSFAQNRRSGKEQKAALFEISPLRTALGSPEARMEGVKDHFGIGLVWSQQQRASERTDYKDRSQVLRVEGLWYPLGMNRVPVFASFGLQHEDALIGRQRERSLTVWARTGPGETHDRWVNKDSYLSVTQSIGYRYVSESLVTAALSVQRDELISEQSRSQDTGHIYNEPSDLRGKGRQHLRTGVMLQVGLYWK